MKKTTVHDNNKQSAIHHLGLPGSSMDGEASNVVLYQKYSVSEDIAHSSTDSLVPLILGHSDQGNVGYKNSESDVRTACCSSIYVETVE